LRPYSPATKAYCAQWNNLKLEKGVIYRQYFDENGGMKYLQLLVPWQMRDTFLQEIHGNVAGHLSTQKTLSRTGARILVWLEKRCGDFL